MLCRICCIYLVHHSYQPKVLAIRHKNQGVCSGSNFICLLWLEGACCLLSADAIHNRRRSNGWMFVLGTSSWALLMRPFWTGSFRLIDLCFCCHPSHPSRCDWDITFAASNMFIPEFGWGKLRNLPILSHVHFKSQWFVDVCYMRFRINQSFEIGSTFSATPGLPCRRTGGSSSWRAGGIQMFSSWIEHGISWVSMHLMYYIICIYIIYIHIIWFI